MPYHPYFLPVLPISVSFRIISGSANISLELVRLRHILPSINTRPLRHPLLPRLEQRKLLNINISPLSREDPAPMRLYAGQEYGLNRTGLCKSYQVCDRALVAHEPVSTRIFEMFLKDGIEPARLIPVSVLSIRDVLRAFAHKVVTLRLHWAHSAVLRSLSQALRAKCV